MYNYITIGGNVVACVQIPLPPPNFFWGEGGIYTQASNVAKLLECWTCNLEALSSCPALTAAEFVHGSQILGHTCK